MVKLPDLLYTTLLYCIVCCVVRAESEPKEPLEQVLAPVHDDISSTIDQYLGFGFWHGFFVSLAVIIVSEIGDKTFFIAAIMAMKHPRLLIFSAAISALVIMTILSVMLGFLTTVIPRLYTFYISTLLFVIFGLKMLHEGWNMAPDEGQEELEEVSQEIKKAEEELENKKHSNDLESGSPTIDTTALVSILRTIMSPIFIQAFTMTFLAEWGDRSQITTIILGSREDPYGIAIGGSLGHSMCTAVAVIGGRMIAQKISVKTVTLIGGCVFLFFAMSSFYLGPGDS